MSTAPLPASPGWLPSTTDAPRTSPSSPLREPSLHQVRKAFSSGIVDSQIPTTNRQERLAWQRGGVGWGLFPDLRLIVVPR